MIQAAREAVKNDPPNHVLAVKYLKKARTLSAEEPYLIQQLALHIYKSKSPNPIDALNEANAVIGELLPDKTNDVETLGIAGAIQKNLWLETKGANALGLAIKYYRRGFEVGRDYYTGENYAACLLLRAADQSEEVERVFDRMLAKKVMQEVKEILTGLLIEKDAAERVDYRWMLATMSVASFFLNDTENAQKNESEFLKLAAAWERVTFLNNKKLFLG